MDIGDIRARAALLALLLAGAVGSGGCVAGLAAGAVGAAAQAATERPVVSDDRRTTAVEACRARAAASGQARIIDAQQRSDGRVTVWGTVESGGVRQAFQCRFDGKVTGFKLRSIAAP